MTDPEILNRLKMLEGNLVEDLSIVRQVISELGQPEQPAESFVRYARVCYNDPDFAPGYHTQILQGQPGTVSKLATIRSQTTSQRLLRYAFPLTYTTHPNWAYRAAIEPSAFRTEWLAQSMSGQRIQSTKFDSGTDSAGKRHYNYLIDVGNVDYQRASLESLIRICRRDGWTGIYLDEIIEFTDYAGYILPKNYPNQYRFQLAQREYVRFIAAGLKAAGFECYINLGWSYTDLGKSFVTACDGQHTEFFIALNTFKMPLANTTEWNRQTEWLRWNESQGKRGFYQADARTEAEVTYALATFLLFSQGVGEFAAFNGGYGLGDAWLTQSMKDAQRIGRPLGIAGYNPDTNIWIREFSSGQVQVNLNTQVARITLRGV